MPDGGDVLGAYAGARADDLALLMKATRSAAALALDFFDRGGVARWDKSPGNPVSAADLAVDAQLKADLLDPRPGYGWLSEETADVSSPGANAGRPARLACRRVWVVDPIDGTRDFIRGRTGWAVSVALVEDGVPVLAALAAPARDQLFVAVAGGGATLNDVRLMVSGRATLAGARLPVDAATLAAPFWPTPWDAVTVETPNSLALRMAHVAGDCADGFFHGRTVAEWDVAAATLIVIEAGGRVGDRDNSAFAFNRPNPEVRGIVAASPALFAELQQRLAAGVTAFAAARARQ